MRAYAVLLPVALAMAAWVGARPAYSPGLAVAFADRHWNWAIASGAPAPVSTMATTRIQARVPGPGWFQPLYECAEFVGRSLHAGGIPVPEVPSSNRRWPVLVNVDRLSYYLISRGWARFSPLGRLRAGDVVLFRYPHAGRPASPTVWSHMALVVAEHPLLLDAHNAAHRHISLAHLREGAWAVRGLRIRLLPDGRRFPDAFRPDSEAAVAWRDLWTTAGVHLYWGQIFRVNGSVGGQVSLAGVRGTVPTTALSPVAATPIRPWHGTVAVILGVTPTGQTLLSTVRSPIPGWTGRVSFTQTPGTPAAWHLVTARTIRVRVSEPLEPVPGHASLPKAWVPKGSNTVVDAWVSWRGRRWAQLEWRGAESGLGYVPWSTLQLTAIPVSTLAHPLHLRGRDGASVTVRPPSALASRHGHYAYAGVFLAPAPSS